MSENAISDEILDIKCLFKGVMPSLYSIPISVSSTLPMKQQCRLLPIKSWHLHMQRCYYKRVNKKWAKQFGFEMIHYVQVGEKIFLSAEMYQRIMVTPNAPSDTKCDDQAK